MSTGFPTATTDDRSTASPRGGMAWLAARVTAIGVLVGTAGGVGVAATIAGPWFALTLALEVMSRGVGTWVLGVLPFLGAVALAGGAVGALYGLVCGATAGVTVAASLRRGASAPIARQRGVAASAAPMVVAGVAATILGDDLHDVLFILQLLVGVPIAVAAPLTWVVLTRVLGLRRQGQPCDAEGRVTRSGSPSSG